MVALKNNATRRTQFPDNFLPKDHHQALAKELGVPLASAFIEFKDFHCSKGSVFKNWDLALNTWLRNARKFDRSRDNGKTTQRQRTDEWLAQRKREIEASGVCSTEPGAELLPTAQVKSGQH